MNLKDFILVHGQNVSRETFSALDFYRDELLKWQKTINLISSTTVSVLEERHFLDSAQLLLHLPPSATSIVDIGSGAGFPGLVLSLLQSRPVFLVESDHRKAAFLNHVILKTNATAQVCSNRVEKLTTLKADIITARGFAPLNRLFTLTIGLCHPLTTFLLLKGKTYKAEIQEAQKHWDFKVIIHPSITDCQAKVLEVQQVSRR